MKHTDRSFWLIQFKFIIFKTRFLFIPSQSWQVEIVLYEALFNNTCTWPTHTHLSLLKLSLSLTHTQRQRVFLFLPCNTDLLFQSLSLSFFLFSYSMSLSCTHIRNFYKMRVILFDRKKVDRTKSFNSFSSCFLILNWIKVTATYVRTDGRTDWLTGVSLKHLLASIK